MAHVLPLLVLAVAGVARTTTVTYDDLAVVIDGQRQIILSGTIDYYRNTPKVTREMWPNLISNAKQGGLNTIETYVFWNGHEPRRRQYNFTGNYDILRFFKEIQNAGMYAILRIGPYYCAEWNYGGLPDWLRNDISGMKFRLHNEPFEVYTSAQLALATKNYKADLFLGEGGFGRVYKGWVNKNTLKPVRGGGDMAIAIRKLKRGSMQGSKEWKAELNYLGKLLHPNLVRLLGYSES